MRALVLSGRSVAAILALLLAGALAPLAGLRLPAVVYLLPAVLVFWLGFESRRAALAVPERSGLWNTWVYASFSAPVVFVLAALWVAFGGSADDALAFGVVAVVLFAAGNLWLAREIVKMVRPLSLVDPLLISGAALVILIEAVLLPSLPDGDPIPIAMFVVSLATIVGCSLAMIGPMATGAKLSLLGAVIAFATAAGFVAGTSAGLGYIPNSTIALTASISYLLAIRTALIEQVRASQRAQRPVGATWLTPVVWLRVLLPMLPLAAFPTALAFHYLVRGEVASSLIVYYSIWFVVFTVIAFLRQAGLLVENRRRAAELRAIAALTGAIVDGGDDEPRLLAAGETIIANALRVGATVHVGAAPPLLGTERRALSIDVALRATEQDLGVVRVERHHSQKHFRRSELTLLEVLAGQLAVGIVNARERRRALESAIRDDLTGLYNRRFFTEALDKELKRHQRYGSVAALVIFDVDELKSINERLGGDADVVLTRVAEVALPHTRPSDSMARLGGGEFGLLMPETGQLDALLAAERIRIAIARTEIVAGLKVTVSGGISALPQDGTTQEEIQRRASDALLWAKRQGRNLCAVAREVDPDSATAQATQGMLNHLHAVVAGIDSAHLYTRDHSENVAAYSVAIGQEMGLSEERVVHLRRAAFLHDIGKIAVPDEVLAKPGDLTDEERRQVRVHPEVGSNMLEHAGLAEEAGWIRHHHERVDGAGYPDGVGGDELAIESRIIFVADAFEAMTSDRPYRLGRPVREALDELGRCAGTQFDPLVVAALVALVERGTLRVMSLRH